MFVSWEKTVRKMPLALLFGMSGAAFALQPLITDDTGTQGSGGNQLEFSYNYDRTKVDGGKERVSTVPLVYTYGLTDTIDIYGGVGYSSVRSDFPESDAAGWINTTIGAKWRFFENEASGTSLAIKPEIVVPVGSDDERDGLGTGKTSGNLTLILSQDMPFGAMHFNAGVGRDRFRDSSGESNTSYRRFSMAPVWDVSEQWKLALDVGIELAHADGDTTRSKFGEIGVIYSPSKDVDLALGFIRTLDHAQPRSATNSVTAGLTWRF